MMVNLTKKFCLLVEVQVKEIKEKKSHSSKNTKSFILKIKHG